MHVMRRIWDAVVGHEGGPHRDDLAEELARNLGDLRQAGQRLESTARIAIERLRRDDLKTKKHPE